MIGFDEALRRYRKGLFGDHDVTRCTGLSVRAWRELIKVGAVRTITEDRGRGRVRLCDATTFKRAAVVAALNQAGFSLAMSGRIAYFLPIDTLLYAFWDPCTILLQVGAEVDPKTGLPPRVERPKTDWFDPDKPAKADPETDWLIEIYDARFVALVCSGEEPFIYGDLRSHGTHFVSWYCFHQLIGHVADKTAQEMTPDKIGALLAKWKNPINWADQLDPGFLDYKYEDHDADNDPLRIAAVTTAQNPVCKTKINVTLAIRKTLRRYLGIEPAVPNSEMG